MHKKGDTAKKVESSTVFLPSALFGVGMAIFLFFLLVFLLAAGIWGGILQKPPGLLLPALAGVCAFSGGRFAIKQGKGNTMLVGTAVAILLILTFAAVFLLRSDKPLFYPPFLSILLMILAGGCLAGVMGRKKKTKRG